MKRSGATTFCGQAVASRTAGIGDSFDGLERPEALTLFLGDREAALRAAEPCRLASRPRARPASPSARSISICRSVSFPWGGMRGMSSVIKAPPAAEGSPPACRPRRPARCRRPGGYGTATSASARPWACCRRGTSGTSRPGAGGLPSRRTRPRREMVPRLPPGDVSALPARRGTLSGPRRMQSWITKSVSFDTAAPSYFFSGTWRKA